jgi:hypothetical protein
MARKANYHTHRFVSLMLGPGILLLAGCGGGASTVSGSVSLDGQPLTRTESRNITIMFTPESGGAPASALVDESGEFSLATGARAGLAPGKYIVTLAAIEVTGGKKQVVTPARYSNAKDTDLRADVQPGSNNFDFELKSGPTS